MQPVANPPGNVKSWMEVLLELADRLGIRADYNLMLSNAMRLKEPYKLDPGKRYCREEIADAWAKSMAGPAHDLEWFRRNGFLSIQRKVKERYPRNFIKARIPLYLEHLLKAGEEVRKITDALGIPWDTNDYQPLPDWKACSSLEEKSGQYDLIAVNYKLPFHTFSHTAGNPWLDDLSQHHPRAYKILLNLRTAKSKGIKESDTVLVESRAGRVKGEVELTEGLHPEVVAIAGTFGHWAAGMPVAKDKGVHFNKLLPCTLERIDKVSAALDACIRVRVSRA